MSDNTGKQLSNNRIAAIWLAGLWALAQLLFAFFLYSNGISIRSNILSLLSQDNFDTPETLQLGSAYLESRSRVLRFTLVADSEQEVIAAASDLRQRLNTLGQISLSPIEEETVLQKNILSLLAPHKASLLSPKQLSKFSNAPGELVQELKQKLYSPLAGFYASFLQADPLLMLPELLLSLKTDSSTRVQSGFLLHDLESDRVSASLVAELLNENMSIDEQGKLVSELNRHLEEIGMKFSNVEGRWSAMLAFAHSSATRLKNDITLLSTLGGIFATGLLVFCFRSLRSLFYCSLSVFSGILCGTFTVVYFTGGIHLITLGIGISLMGACIDYSLHFLSECFFSGSPGSKICAVTARNKVFRPISLGALTSILAFLALKLSSFPGLQELALFALGSIIASSTTVLVWLPLLVRGKCIAPPAIFERTQAKLSNLGGYLGKAPKSGIAITVAILGSSLVMLNTNDDIRALQTPKKQLIDNEVWIQNSGGFPKPTGYILVADKEKESLLSTLYEAHYLLEELKESGVIGGFQSLYGLIPSKEIQTSNKKTYLDFVKNSSSELDAAFSSLGYSERMKEKVRELPPEKPLELETLLALVPGNALGISTHSSDDGSGVYYSGAIPVFELHNRQALEQAIESIAHLRFFKPADDISSQFLSYRTESTWLVAVAYIIIFAFLYCRYGKKGFFRAAVALIGGIFGTFVVLALLGQSVSFFSVLAVILVLGLGVDFSIFALEDASLEATDNALNSKDQKHTNPAVSIAILLAAASTVVSFGLLAISSTAVLHSIGIIVSVGVLLCVVICLSMSRESC